MPAAELVLVGGDVVTMDRAARRAIGVAVAGGRIRAVGDDTSLGEWIGPRTRVVRLRGRTLLPGFTDAHVHPVLAGPELLRCSLHEVGRTPDAYLSAIAAYAAAHADEPWVVGGGWYMEAFPGGTPTAAALDRVVPDRPAYLANRDVHGAWVNSRALALAGIDRTTPDPPDGRIERDATGEPTGTLHEGAADLVGRLVPPLTLEERVRGLAAAQAYLHRLGIVAWQDAWVEPAGLDAYVALAERGGLTGRATVCHWWERGEGVGQVDGIVERRRRASIGRLGGGTVKIMVDGVAENWTAAMLEPYLDGDGRPTANRGTLFLEPDALRAAVARLDAAAFQVHFHALGDRAVRESLDAIESARRANGPADRRHHLAHLQVVDPADVGRFARLGAVATIQPYWACNDAQMTELTTPFLPPTRAALQYPFASLLRAGAMLAGGSDWSVSTPDVLAQVEVAVTRVSRDAPAAEPLLPGESIGLLDALRAFTVGGAYVCHREADAGTIEPGKLADLVVLDRDLLGQAASGASAIGDARVVLTLVEGEPVFEDPSLESG